MNRYKFIMNSWIDRYIKVYIELSIQKYKHDAHCTFKKLKLPWAPSVTWQTETQEFRGYLGKGGKGSILEIISLIKIVPYGAAMWKHGRVKGHRVWGTEEDNTGCSLNIVFFPIYEKYSGLWPFSVFPRCQCVHTHHAGRTPALQQNWQSSEKSQHFKEKHNI